MQVKQEYYTPRSVNWHETIEEKEDEEKNTHQYEEDEKVKEENEIGMRSDQSIYGSSSDSSSLETQGISLVFQLNSLTECTSCSDNENVPDDDNQIEWEKRRKKKKKKQTRINSQQSIQVTQDKQNSASDDEEEEKNTFHLNTDQDTDNDEMNESDCEHYNMNKLERGGKKYNKYTINRSNSSKATKYQVISEVKLNKYDFDGKTLKLLSKLHEQLGSDNCPLSYRVTGDKLIKCDPITGSGGNIFINNNINCKLCNILACRLNESWDLLDTETVTLMDIIERLSRILSDKAKQLIVKLKRQQQQNDEQDVKIVSTCATSEDEMISQENKSQIINTPAIKLTQQNTGSRNPLKDLKDSGITVRKVENRKRFITLRDGDIEYCIQGKRLLHVLTFFFLFFSSSPLFLYLLCTAAAAAAISR